MRKMTKMLLNVTVRNGQSYPLLFSFPICLELLILSIHFQFYFRPENFSLNLIAAVVDVVGREEKRLEIGVFIRKNVSSSQIRFKSFNDHFIEIFTLL